MNFNINNAVFIDCNINLRYPDREEGKLIFRYGKIDLTDSVISGCTLNGVTLENVKSTWNYKNNRMEGITLPSDIQKALDAEKKLE